MGTETWLDPTAQEVRLSQGTLILSCMPALGIITSLWESGQMKTKEALTVGSSTSKELQVYLLILLQVCYSVSRAMY